MPALHRIPVATVLAVLLSRSTASAGQVLIFESDFDEPVLDPGLFPNNYVFEEYGTFAPVGELAVTTESGGVRIAGRKEADTVVLEGHDVGWIGSAISLEEPIDASSTLSVEADVTVHGYSKDLSGINAGFVLYLTLEFDRNNRIIFNLMESAGLGARFVQMHLEESDVFMTCWSATEHCMPRPFSNGQTMRLRLEFDPETSTAKGFIDGVQVLRRPFAGALAAARVSLGAALRGQGDTIDVTFDNLLVTQAGPPEVLLRRGDANGDGRIDISDPVSILECLFLGRECGSCPDAWDSNDDGVIHIGDPVHLLEWLFREGSPPTAPFPACGQDSTPDTLAACEELPPCTD